MISKHRGLLNHGMEWMLGSRALFQNQIHDKNSRPFWKPLYQHFPVDYELCD